MGKTTKLKGKISIGRTHGHDCNYITIEIVDCNSRVRFVKVNLSYEDFAKALTGLAYNPMEFEINNLDVIGKVKEQKDLIFLVGDSSNHIQHVSIAENTCQEYTEKGWTASTYFRSKDSIQKHDDGKYYAYGTQFRFVEEEK